MLIHKKVMGIIICGLILLSCSASYSADYIFATRDMTWAEFYAGETNQTSSALETAGLDAVSTPTKNAFSRFPLLLGVSNDEGTTLSGLKAVQVRMTQDVYNSMSAEEQSRYSIINGTFSEYKDVNADGSFGKMVTQTTDVSSTAKVTISGGASSTWGNYTISITGVEIEIGSANRYCDYYLGATIETTEGTIYGLRHDSNLWSDAGSIAFCVKDFVEVHGVSRDYKYTASLEGKTIKKIVYMLKDRPDIVIDNLNLAVPSQTTVTVSQTEEPEDGYLAASGIALKMTFSSASPVFTVKSVYIGSGRNRTVLDPSTYTYANGILTLNGEVRAGSYTAIFGSEGYVDIKAEFTLYSTDATSLIISGDNAGGVNFLLTPKGASSKVDAAVESGNFVYASDYTDAESNHSIELSGMWHEVEGSGFSFDIAMTGIPAGKTAVVGFGKMFFLTPENCGEIYPYIYSAIDALPISEGAYKHIEGDEFKAMGLRAMTIRNGQVEDYTKYTGAGAMISDDEHILIYYGIMLADANTGEVDEGKTYLFSPEGETLISDGARDSHLRMAMYFEILNSDPATVEDANNLVGIGFSYMPEGFFEQADQNAENAKVQWLSKEYNNVLSGGYSRYITGYANQISGNSGFEFSIPVNTSAIPSGYSAISGFERPFSFTASNIGTDDYNTLRARVAALPDSGSEWKSPGDNGGAILRAANIHVIAVYPDGSTRDITNLIQYGIKEDGNSITMNYGAIAVDRALTSNEGEKLEMGFEASPLMSDGLADGNVTATWYLAHTSDSTVPGSPSGGCNSLSFTCTAALLLFAFMNSRKK